MLNLIVQIFRKKIKKNNLKKEIDFDFSNSNFASHSTKKKQKKLGI